MSGMEMPRRKSTLQEFAGLTAEKALKIAERASFSELPAVMTDGASRPALRLSCYKSILSGEEGVPAGPDSGQSLALV
ncbi:MAG: hypothetical protein Q8J78_16545 [Moraxellaceae bacterium]|nr:hypothetical protein [Moraxellaceae bacterium]